VNEWGLLGAALLSVGIAVLPFAITKGEWPLIGLSLPFAIVGTIALVDDLFLNERIIKRLLDIKEGDLK